jgi:CubicO group peptidase (beta-lactamase class C family)
MLRPFLPAGLPPIAALLLAACASAPEAGSPLTVTHGPGEEAAVMAQRVEALLAPYVASGDASGGLRIERGGEVLVEASFGLADQETGRANGPATLFTTGSITKSVTATLILGLAEEGRLDLDAPLSAYLPELRGAERYTVGDVLGHRAGLPRDVPLAERKDFEALGMTAWLNERPLTPYRREDAVYAYSNVGYRLLAILAERVTGEPYGTLARERIARPLGLEGFCAMEDCPKGLVAKGYKITASGQEEAEAILTAPGPTGVMMTNEALIGWAEAVEARALQDLHPETGEPIGGVRPGRELAGRSWLRLQGSEFGGGAAVYVDPSDGLAFSYAVNLSSFPQWSLDEALGRIIAGEELGGSWVRPSAAPLSSEHERLEGTYEHPSFGQVVIGFHEEEGLTLTVPALSYTWELLPLEGGGAFWPFFGTVFRPNAEGGGALEASAFTLASPPETFELPPAD